MREWTSEFAHNYETYSFGYAHYCQREESDALHDMYAHGYLPFSGSPDVADVFYMARSIRVHAPSFTLTSENRRVARKFDDLFESTATPVKDFTDTDTLIPFVTNYFETILGPGIMPVERLRYVLAARALSHIVHYTDGEKTAGYVLLAADEHFVHPWFVAYAPEYAKQSFGIWLMLDTVRRAKEGGKEYAYLGTGYGGGARYKMNFTPTEYWDGTGWVHEKKNASLKALAAHDEENNTDHSDRWSASLRHFGEEE